MRSDRWLGPLMMLLAVLWLVLVYQYIPGARNEAETGPRSFPVVLGVALLGLGALISASAMRTPPKASIPAETSATGREITVVAGTFGLLVLFAFLMEKAGFLIATPVVVLLTMVGILQMRNWLFMLQMTAGVTLVCWLFFVVLLKIPMPQGSWLWLL